MHRMLRSQPPITKTLPLLFTITLAMTGCAGGVVTTTTYATAGTAAGLLYKKRQEFKNQLHQDYQTYQVQFTDAGCRPEEYRISDVIYQFIESSPATVDGFAEAQNILLDIYRNDTLSREVRAHALYYVALTEIERDGGSRETTRAYLRKVKTEFPGTHDCAIDVLLDEEGKI